MSPRKLSKPRLRKVNMSDSIKLPILTRDEIVLQNKSWRQRLDVILQEIKESPYKSRNRFISYTCLEDSIMRLGMDLKDINAEPNPYPNSYDTTNTIVDKTADGLKL